MARAAACGTPPATVDPSPACCPLEPSPFRTPLHLRRTASPARSAPDCTRSQPRPGARAATGGGRGWGDSGRARGNELARVLDFRHTFRNEDSVAKTARIETSKGSIVADLFDTETPATVTNFEKLANSEFYDGTRFHRV